MRLLAVAHFLSLTFENWGTNKTLQHVISFTAVNQDMLQCFVCSPIPQVSEKKWATAQSFIQKEITTYRIGTLDQS